MKLSPGKRDRVPPWHGHWSNSEPSWSEDVTSGGGHGTLHKGTGSRSASTAGTWKRVPRSPLPWAQKAATRLLLSHGSRFGVHSIYVPCVHTAPLNLFSVPSLAVPLHLPAPSSVRKIRLPDSHCLSFSLLFTLFILPQNKLVCKLLCLIHLMQHYGVQVHPSPWKGLKFIHVSFFTAEYFSTAGNGTRSFPIHLLTDIPKTRWSSNMLPQA